MTNSFMVFMVSQLLMYASMMGFCLEAYRGRITFSTTWQEFSFRQWVYFVAASVGGICMLFFCAGVLFEVLSK